MSKKALEEMMHYIDSETWADEKGEEAILSLWTRAQDFIEEAYEEYLEKLED